MNADKGLSRRRLLAAGVAALAAPRALAQGFAGMGAEAAEFAQVVPGVRLEFPRDHLAHPGFRIEWWYVTANLRGADGQPYGAQFTLFRNAFAPGDEGVEGWESPQLWMGHAALTSRTEHRAAERFARGGIGQGGVAAPPFRAWIDDWALAQPEGAAGDYYDRLAMRARGEGFSYALDLTAEGPLVLHGRDGYSLKSQRGQASYYYSQPFYRVEGEIAFDGAPLAVTGRAWLDREWSSQPLDETQTGWDWFSLSFDTGEKAMLFRIRESGGGASFAGTWIAPDGAAAPIPAEAIALRPLATARVAGRETPVRWAVEIAERGVSVEVAALNPQSWNALSVPYWEGPVTMTGTHPGEGYLEMTGY